MALRPLNRSMSTSQGRARVRRRHVMHIILNTALITALIVVSGGLFLAWYTARSSVVEVNPPPVLEKKLTEPVKQADNAPVGVYITVLTSPIVAGSNASVTIKTKADAACSIRVEYNKQPSTDLGLTPKTADEFGIVTWDWKVESSRPVGKWPIDITCAKGDKSGYMRGDLIITAP